MWCIVCISICWYILMYRYAYHTGVESWVRDGDGIPEGLPEMTFFQHLKGFRNSLGDGWLGLRRQWRILWCSCEHIERRPGSHHDSAANMNIWILQNLHNHPTQGKSCAALFNFSMHLCPARLDLLLECVGSRPEAMDVFDPRGLWPGSMSLMSLSDCLLTHLDDSWRLTQGFMMVYEELTSLADLVISKGLTQDWDVPSFTGLLSNFAWISQKTCQLSACFDVI